MLLCVITRRELDEEKLAGEPTGSERHAVITKKIASIDDEILVMRLLLLLSCM